MKLITTIKKQFSDVIDYMDVNEDDSRLEYYGCTNEEDACEPDYIVSVFDTGVYIVRSINGSLLFQSTNESEFKKFIKTLK